MAKLSYVGTQRGAQRGGEWTTAALWRTLWRSAAWSVFFLVCGAVEVMVAAIQRRMSSVLYFDSVPVLLLGVCYAVEAVAMYRLLRFPGPTPAPSNGANLAPVSTNVFTPGVVRFVLGRALVFVVGPIALGMWASLVGEKTENLVVDGFVACVLVTHLGAFLWDAGLAHAASASSLRWRSRGESLSILTFNVNRCIGRDGKLDVGRMVEIVQSARPTVVALQNVPLEDGQTSVMSQVAQALRMEHRAVGVTEDGDVGHAVLVSSEWEIVGHEAVPLSSWQNQSSVAWSRPKPCVALVVTMRPAGSSPARTFPVTIVSTAFGADASGVQQTLATQELARALRRQAMRGRGSRPGGDGSGDNKALLGENSGGATLARAPRIRSTATPRCVLPAKLIVCGDLQMSSSSVAARVAAELGLVDTVRAGWSGAIACGCNRSSAVRTLLRRPDRVLLNANGPLRAVSTSIINALDASNHSPVLATVVIPATAVPH